MRGRRHAVALLLALAVPVGATAQEPATLDRVEELARLGRTQEAREMVGAWWRDAGARPPRRELQRGLWLRGILALDPGEAAMDFRRLVIEFPGGTYSDQALFRLAQSAYAAGDSAGAAAAVGQLGREYPASPVRREAEAWLETAGPVPERLAGDSLVAGAPPAEAEVSPAPGAPAPAEAGAPPEEAPRGRFAVQLGAFSSMDRAEALRRRASAAGFEARLVRVPGSGLVRVRVGTFDSAEGAGEILGRLRDLGFTAAVARDAHREEPVR